MDLKQIANMVEALRGDILWMARQWMESVPDKDKPFYASGSGKTLSARDIVQEMEQRSPRGEEFVLDWIRLAVNKAMFEMHQTRTDAPAEATVAPREAIAVG